MNRLKNIILIICIMFILSGCTIRSNITLNYDGTVDENVSVLASTKVFESNTYSKEQIIDGVIEDYQSILEFKNYSYDYVLGNDLSGSKLYKKYDDICQYFGNSAFNQYVYKYMECTDNDYYYEIKNATEYIPYCSDCSDWPALDDVTLSITLPIPAEEQNADEIDGNTYIWKYDKDTENKNFYLKINKSSLEAYEKEYIEEQESKKVIKRVIVIAIIVIIILIIGIVGTILYKKRKKNSIDY